MVPNSNAYETYQKQKILTATPAELTLMLYEGAIKFLNVAIMGIEKSDMEKAHNNIQKAQRIIDEFRATLDFKYQVAKEFDKVYEYLQYRLVWANVKKDIEIIEECLGHLRGMRDTWKEVMKTSKMAPAINS